MAENVVVAGDKILYCAADGGRILDDLNLSLVPGEVLTAGEELTVEFATRLVEDHVCEIITVESTPVQAEASPKEDAQEPRSVTAEESAAAEANQAENSETHASEPKPEEQATPEEPQVHDGPSEAHDAAPSEAHDPAPSDAHNEPADDQQQNG